MAKSGEKKTRPGMRSDESTHIPSIPFLLLLGCLVVPVTALQAGQPDWVGEAGTTRQSFQFTTNSTQPAPEVLENEFGDPLSSVTVTQPYGSGWQDPAEMFSTPGVNADGAWDVGPDGTIAITLPIAPENSDPGLYYHVEFYIYAVAYEFPVALPGVSSPGLSLENVSSTSAVVLQETLGRYTGLTWTAEAGVLSGNSVTILLSATSSGAVIDSVDIHTRYTLRGEPTFLFATWTTTNFPDVTDPSIIGFTAAPDGDGLSNGLKYYFGLDRNMTGTPMIIEDGDPANIVLVHMRNKTGTPDITGAYEWSPDLVGWHGDGESSAGLTINFQSRILDDSNPEFDLVETTAKTVTGTADQLFVRLSVTQPTD